MKNKNSFYLSFENSLYLLLLVAMALLPFYGFSGKDEPGISEPPLMKTLYTFSLLGAVIIAAFFKMQRANFKTNLAEKAVFPFLAIGVLSLWWTAKIDYTLYELLLAGIIVATYFVSRWLINSQLKAQAMLWVMLTAAFFVSMIGVIQYLIDPDFLARGRTEVASVFGNKNLAMHYLVLVVPIGFYLLLKANFDAISRATAAVLLLAVLLFISYSGTRSAYVGLLLPMAIMVAATGYKIYTGKMRYQRHDWLILVAFIVLYFVLLSASSVGFNPVISALDVSRGTSGRTCIWESTWQMIQAKPLLGWGLGSYEYVNYIHDSCGRPVQRVHNEYLQALMELGVVGFVAALAFLVIASVGMLKRSFAELLSGDTQLLHTAIFCTFLATGTQSLFTFPYQLHYNALVLVVLLAIGNAKTIDNARATATKKDSKIFISIKTLWALWIAFAIYNCALWAVQINTYSSIFQLKLKSLQEIKAATPLIENPMINEVALHALAQEMPAEIRLVLLEEIIRKNTDSVHLLYQAAYQGELTNDAQLAARYYAKIEQNIRRNGVQMSYLASYMRFLERTTSYHNAREKFISIADPVVNKMQGKKFLNLLDQIVLAQLMLQFQLPQAAIDTLERLHRDLPHIYKSESSLALYMGVAYESLGNIEQAIYWFEIYKQYFADKDNIQQVINSLTALKQRL